MNLNLFVFKEALHKGDKCDECVLQLIDRIDYDNWQKVWNNRHNLDIVCDLISSNNNQQLMMYFFTLICELEEVDLVKLIYSRFKEEIDLHSENSGWHSCVSGHFLQLCSGHLGSCMKSYDNDRWYNCHKNSLFVKLCIDDKIEIVKWFCQTDATFMTLLDKLINGTLLTHYTDETLYPEVGDKIRAWCSRGCV